jgi:hypothetical protein
VACLHRTLEVGSHLGVGEAGSDQPLPQTLHLGVRQRWLRVAGPPLVDQDELAVDPLGAGSESRIVRSLAEIDPEDETGSGAGLPPGG